MHDMNDGWSVKQNSSLEPTYNSASSGEQIQDVAKRPILIYSFAWDTLREVSETFDPWTLFFTNPRVINRIANFKLLRSNLQLTFQINGNPFYYGRMLASYVPLPTVDTISTDREGVIQDRIEGSQRMHIYLDPTTSTGGEMNLPFIYPKNAIEITRGEFNRLGRISLATMSPLKHANKADQPVTISVWASAQDMVVDQLTSLNPLEIEEQSGVASRSEAPSNITQDEYVDGPVSKPATAVAKMAGKLGNIPVIGPYARATAIAAKATAMVAKIFGYSKPRVIEQSRFFNSTLNARAQNVDGEEMVETLALTLKQETTIDPRTMNTPLEDEMALVPLARKESFLTKFSWKETDPPQKLLFNVRVSPTLFDTYNVTQPTEIHMTPMCWVATPFEFWRGSLEFRFQVVCSSYHKGRIRLVYDPNYQATTEYNVNRQMIVDLSSDSDFTMKIGWGQAVNYLPITHMETGVVPFSTAPINASLDNGVLSVFVVNELTSPSEEPNDVEVLCFVKACEDFSVNVPYDATLNRASIVRTFPDLGPGWRNLTIPGTFLFNENFTPGQTVRDNLSTFQTDAAVNGVPDYNGNRDFFLPIWNQSVTTDAVSVSLRIGYVNNTGVSANLTISGPGTTTVVDLEPNTTDLDIEVFVTPQVPPGFSKAVINLAVTNWASNDAMKLVVWDYTISVPGAIDYYLYEPGNSLVTGTGVKPHPTATFDNGASVDAWDLTYPGAEIVINPPIGTRFAPLTPVVFFKPEGEPDLSTTLGPLAASPTGTGFNLVKTPAIEDNADDPLIVSQVSGEPYLCGVLAFVEDLEFQSGVTTPDEAPSSSKPAGTSYEYEAGNSLSPADAASLIHFGEEPVSWRTCLKRFQTVVHFNNGTATSFNRYTRPVSPAYESVIATATTPTTLFHWVTPAYVCWKGALRYRVDDGNVDFQPNTALNTFWTHGPYGGVEFKSNSGPTATTVLEVYSWAGSAHQGFYEVPAIEVPWYNYLRFQFGRSLVGPNNVNSLEYHREFTLHKQLGSTNSHLIISQAAGEDFTLACFLSTPVVSLS